MSDVALENCARAFEDILTKRHPEYVWTVEVREDHPRGLQVEPCQAEVVEPDGPVSPC
jgi:hypothetical protein